MWTAIACIDQCKQMVHLPERRPSVGTALSALVSIAKAPAVTMAASRSGCSVMMRFLSKFTIALVGSNLLPPADAPAQPGPAQSLYIRVVDVGPGLCVIGLIPGGHSFVYDTGPPRSICSAAVDDLITLDTIDLLVLSHSDKDHIGDLKRILGLTTTHKHVRLILHPGDHRTGDMINDARQAIAVAVANGAREVNLAKPHAPDPGTRYQVGDATFTYVGGWSDGRKAHSAGEPAPSIGSEINNVLSIVLRLEYGGHSVLLSGDTLGRNRPTSSGKLDDGLACRYAERIMVDRSVQVPVASEVLVGQHHGGDNSSSNCFIEAVRPTYVVFSAGHAYGHPWQSVADRFVGWGVKPENMLRTDRGDNEGGNEWITGAILHCVDKPLDDDIEIVMSDDPNVPIKVGYRLPQHGC
jgi:competence protein ComEC